MTLAQEVADLIGRPLAEVPDVDFRLSIQPAGNGRWRSSLEAIEHRPGVPEARHVRALEAKSCADLGEAAAVAMSVSIRAVGEAAAPPTGSRAAPATPDATIVGTGPAPVAPPATHGLAAAALAADAGELPGVGLGLTASFGIARGAARLNVFGGWLPPRDHINPKDGTGGSFQLAFGGAEGCFAPSWGSWTALGCVGGELGVQSGSGVGVTIPGSGTALWRAARLTLGFVFRLADRLGFLAGATGVVPLVRPQFVLDQTNAVYRAAPIAIRLGAGVELIF
jgi:hypothetical protein